MSTYYSVPTVTYETAARAVAIGLRHAEAAGVRAVVTVMDPSLVVVAVGRADGAPPHSVETSRRKAITASSTRKPSAAIPEENITLLEHGSGGLLTGIKGGVPLVFDGVHTGGLGIAGGSPEQDAEIAAATLAELGTDKAEA
ncbi:heme-binding protein [Humibacter sp.]|jgi:glc operon protein GlcG|uniref:GlcG/HbpS family heme-binding protein n=1 Tax=Humibacter sp. TaxID=1940291 RepID=UPI002CA1B49A|nr:heme-binding protein [Humibacter sp.]HVX06972.1 heme-binding protein [Humibacter sp.]